MHTPGATELETAREEALERRRRAREIPFDKTRLGATLTTHLNDVRARVAAGEQVGTDPNVAKIRAERMHRRWKRAEARRLTLDKYAAQLRRATRLRNASAASTVRGNKLAAASVTTTPRPREARPRRQRQARRALARAPGQSDEPEPPRAATAICEGCGRVFTPRRPNQRHHDAACRVRAHRQRTAITPLERYYEEVWKARASGALTESDVVELLVSPSELVLERLAAA